MSDIFVSYSSKDRDRAAQVARALQARGWSVWWDRTIPPGRQFDEVIEEALDAARCVVVLWTADSAASAWVRNEASEALSKKALIPALLETGVRIPFEFRRVQAADLSRWNGVDATPEFTQFCEAIAGELARVPATGAADAPAPAPAFTVTPAFAAAAPAVRQAWRTPAAPEPAAADTHPFAADTQPAVAMETLPATPPRSRKKAWLIGGGIVLALLVVAGLVPDTHDGSGASPAPAPMNLMAGGNGIHQNLTWRDDVLVYSGNVSWDGRSDRAEISLQVADSITRTPLGSRQLMARVGPNGTLAGQIVVSTSVPVAGDSRTPSPHSHDVNLVFQAEPNGNWAFLRNCMTPNDCY